MKKRAPTAAAPAQAEAGQSLVVIILLGALLAIFGTALTRMLATEAQQVVRTKQRDKLFTAGDAALQRSVSALLTDNNWALAESLPGFGSLTVTAYTDIPGLTYYVRIRAGTLSDTAQVGADSDLAINAWTNVGDLAHDRTIFVRTVETATGREDRFYTTVHRTPPTPNPGAKGIQAKGTAALAGWDGVTYDSCPGGIGGSVASPTPAPGTDGEVIAPNITGGGSFQLKKTVGTPGELPSAALPTGPPATEPVPGNTSVAQNASGSKNLGPSSGPKGSIRRYQVHDLSMGGSTTYNVDATNGPIELYVTGTFTLSGNVTINVNSNGWNCCTAKGFTVFMVGGGNITWNGTPTGTMNLYGPDSNMTMNGTGNGDFKGAITVNNLNVSGGGTGVFHYDKCLSKRGAADNYEAPPLVTTSWHQIGLKGGLAP